MLRRQRPSSKSRRPTSRSDALLFAWSCALATATRPRCAPDQMHDKGRHVGNHYRTQNGTLACPRTEPVGRLEAPAVQVRDGEVPEGEVVRVTLHERDGRVLFEGEVR
jgi:hypothetical protein